MARDVPSAPSDHNRSGLLGVGARPSRCGGPGSGSPPRPRHKRVFRRRHTRTGLPLSNTTKTVIIAHRPARVLLRNALIDTRQPVEIPEALKAGEASGSTSPRRAAPWTPSATTPSSQRRPIRLLHPEQRRPHPRQRPRRQRAALHRHYSKPSSPRALLQTGREPATRRAGRKKPRHRASWFPLPVSQVGVKRSLQSLQTLGVEVLGEERPRSARRFT